jgi:chromosome segregation ATPase
MKELLFPPALIMRALDDLSAIAAAARRLTALEADVLGRMDRVERLVLEHLGTIEAELAHLAPMKRGIDPLDDDMRAVRESVDDLEPLLEQVNTRLGALADRIESLQTELAPLGELADKIPGVGR